MLPRIATDTAQYTFDCHFGAFGNGSPENAFVELLETGLKNGSKLRKSSVDLALRVADRRREHQAVDRLPRRRHFPADTCDSGTFTSAGSEPNTKSLIAPRICLSV